MKKIVSFLCLLILLTACSHSQVSIKKEEINNNLPAKAPTDLNGILSAKPGKYAGDKYDKAKVEAELDKLPNKLTPDQAYNVLISLLGEDFRPIVAEFNQFDPNIKGSGSGPEGIMGPNIKLKKKVNIEILLDSSGSMAEKVGGQTKMDLAKQAINQFVSSMPQGANVALRVYGHKGSNQDKDKSLSCSSSEVVYPLGAYDSQKFGQSLQQFRPTGWTPLALAIQSAQQDLSAQSDAENIIYIVSDGIETCGGNPVKEAKTLHNSNVKAVVNIIGFDVNNAGQRALQQVAQSGGGTYYTVNNPEDLKAYFDKQYEELSQRWAEWSYQSGLNAMQQANKKVEEIGKISDKGYAILNREEAHLQDALNYLSTKGKIDSTVSIIEKMNDRYRTVGGYLLNRKDELVSKILNNRDQKINEATQRQKDAQNQIDQQRGN